MTMFGHFVTFIAVRPLCDFHLLLFFFVLLCSKRFSLFPSQPDYWNFLSNPGQPKRHLLTTGWSLFVGAKRLRAGDSVLFIRYICKFSFIFSLKLYYEVSIFISFFACGLMLEFPREFNKNVGYAFSVPFFRPKSWLNSILRTASHILEENSI